MAPFLVGRPLALLGAFLLLAGTGAPLCASPTAIPLQCRRQSGPWRACTMLVEQVGQHWWLVIEGDRFEFTHDGTGRMRLRQEGGDWRDVESRWAADTSLCWNGICAFGPIPLD
jgi:hypothetical protein